MKEVFHVFNNVISDDFEYIFRNFFTLPGYPTIFASKSNATTLELIIRSNFASSWNIPLQLVHRNGDFDEFWLENVRDGNLFDITVQERIIFCFTYCLKSYKNLGCKPVNHVCFVSKSKYEPVTKMDCKKLTRRQLAFIGWYTTKKFLMKLQGSPNF